MSLSVSLIFFYSFFLFLLLHKIAMASCSSSSVEICFTLVNIFLVFRKVFFFLFFFFFIAHSFSFRDVIEFEISLRTLRGPWVVSGPPVSQSISVSLKDLSVHVYFLLVLLVFVMCVMVLICTLYFIVRKWED